MCSGMFLGFGFSLHYHPVELLGFFWGDPMLGGHRSVVAEASWGVPKPWWTVTGACWASAPWFHGLFRQLCSHPCLA